MKTNHHKHNVTECIRVRKDQCHCFGIHGLVKEHDGVFLTKMGGGYLLYLNGLEMVSYSMAGGSNHG